VTVDAADSLLRAPFPYPGGKRRIADVVWAALGNPRNYIEPFFGSGAVLLARPHAPQIETVNDANGLLCLAPETRLLGVDLRWRTAGSVAVGDELIAFDEENSGRRPGALGAPTHYRHWRETKVTATRRTVKPCYRLTFDDGTIVIASADHMWLGGSHQIGSKGGRGWRWLRTDRLVCNRATQRSWVLKLCDVVEQEETSEAGWLSGFYDGEGSLRNAPGWRVNVTQKLGDEADRVERLLRARGFSVTKAVRHRHVATHQPVAAFEINGGMRETLRFLMRIRPERLIRNLRRHLGSMSLFARERQAVGLVSKEYLGEREVVAIETESHTFVAEGLASHNCNVWRALRRNAAGVARHADHPVNELDLHAWHRLLVTRAREVKSKLERDPRWCDVELAGRWIWGASMWIGAGWCAVRETPKRQRPQLVRGGRGVHKKRPSVSGTNAGRGVERPGLHENAPDVHRKIPEVGGQGGRGTHGHRVHDLTAWFATLQQRLRKVRVCCGDFERVLGPAVLATSARDAFTGVFLDPPYAHELRDPNLYANEDATASARARAWCLANGANPRLRVVLAGLGEEHDALLAHGWWSSSWTGASGYARVSGNRHHEKLWFSPHCLRADGPLFGGLA